MVGETKEEDFLECFTETGEKRNGAVVVGGGGVTGLGQRDDLRQFPGVRDDPLGE